MTDTEALKALVALRKAEQAAQTGPLGHYEQACAAFERAARDSIPAIERMLATQTEAEAVAWRNLREGVWYYLDGSDFKDWYNDDTENPWLPLFASPVTGGK